MAHREIKVINNTNRYDHFIWYQKSLFGLVWAYILFYPQIALPQKNTLLSPVIFIYPKTSNPKRDTMKKSNLPTFLFFLFPAALFAQIGGIEDSVGEISDTIRSIFPMVLGVIFLVGFLFNVGHFFGENSDLKKGITRVLVFVLISGAVVGIFTYLISITV